MTPNLNSCQIRGNVVETFEMGGDIVLRVSITGGSVDILSDIRETFHLGDVLLLEGEFRPCSVKPALDREDHHTPLDADSLA
jgi:hypothetical protein